MAKTGFSKHRAPWTNTDIKTLKIRSKQRVPVKKISKEMQRTVAAIRMKAHQIGIGIGTYH